MNLLGKIISPQAERVNRLSICMKCENLKGVLLLRCAACGCLIKSKVTVAASACPKGKW